MEHKMTNSGFGPCHPGCGGQGLRRKWAVVIGGMNMDIRGRPSGRLLMGDSNPGAISLRPGGVGRNIAHDLCLLGLDVSLVTALGEDFFSSCLEASCREAGIDLSMAERVPGGRGGAYMYVTDGAGDMSVAVSDMEITEKISPALIERCLERINKAGAVVVDANLPEETVGFIAAHCTAPVYADPVSAAKAGRLGTVLHRLEAIKPNALEAEALTGERQPERAAAALLARGVRRVYISLGEKGLLAAEKGRTLTVPAERVSAANTNGAGDAAMAALVWAGTMGLGLEESARAAVLAGAITAASTETNAPELKELSEMMRA